MWSIIKDYWKYRFLAATFFCCLFLVSCGNGVHEETIISGTALGTTYQVKYFGNREFDPKNGIDSVFKAINHSMSTYMENSLISKINQGDSTVVVDDMFADVFKASKKIYMKTDGHFDPTVGKMVNFYGFGPEKFSLEIDSANVDSLMNYIGFEKVSLTPKNTIQKAFPTIYIDFNAIAKGYSVDRLAAFLEQNNIQNYLVEVGGELVAHGKNLETDEPWRIGIDDPDQSMEKRTLAKVIELQDQGMATSGNYRKFRIDSVTGEKYVHTIDPPTGYPARNNILSATVLAPNCMLADGYATSLMALGLEKSVELLKTLPEIDAYLIYAENDDIQSFMTEGFRKQLVKE